jgi:aspartyl protease family protein
MKFAPFFFVTVGMAALVGLMAPRESEPAPATEASAAPDTRTHSDRTRRPARHAGEEVLERAADGHFYANVVVDGSSALMLVDTGATMVALTGEDAEAMGIRWSRDDVEPVARGASGTVYGVPVTIRRMELGAIEARGVEAIVVPEGLGISLLGQSFLSQISRVEMDRDKMVLGG